MDEVNCGLSDYTDQCVAFFRANGTKMREISPGHLITVTILLLKACLRMYAS